MHVCLKFRRTHLQKINLISISVNIFLILFSQVGSCKTAYDVQKLKFTSGEKERALKTIITSQHSHILCLYKEACKNVNYAVLSESSLWNILNTLKPSRILRLLAGLNHIVAAGMNRFNILQTVSKSSY